jgi:hypothetical protein
MAVRTVAAGTAITVTDGDGVSGNPTVAATIASQVEAEAGTATDKLMTPQRTKQAIDALASAESIVLLGTVNTTSGSTQTLSGLDLTGYKQVQAWLNGVDPSTTATTSIISVGGATAVTAQAGSVSAFVVIDLLTGRSASINSFDDRGVFSSSTLTTSSTSISVTTTQTFASGSVRFYGVK